MYGAEDIWSDGVVDEEEVNNQLIIYLGVMFGVSGAAAGLRVLSSAFSKAALKKLPQIALTKTTIYPIIKSAAKIIGARMTKQIFAKGVAEIIPVVGGLVSGGITLASMPKMGKRLVSAFETGMFGYTKEAFDSDIEELNSLAGRQDIIDAEYEEAFDPPPVILSPADEIVKYKKLYDEGIITETEFAQIKERLIAMI